MNTPRSALYEGWVRHRRRAPVGHSFRYPVFMMYLDLEELDDVFDGRWFWSNGRANLMWLRRSDYLAPHDLSIKEAVADRVEAQTGWRPDGPIRLLTQLRTFGFSFNPVSFYYCFDRTGERVECIVAEINNTPWDERHAYVLHRRDRIGTGKNLRFSFSKEFHVSPFFPMEQTYDWSFTSPAEGLVVHMNNLERGDRVFDATLSLRRRGLSAATLAGAIARFPFQSLRIVGRIYWQALRLYLKRVPFIEHPKNRRAV